MTSPGICPDCHELFTDCVCPDLMPPGARCTICLTPISRQEDARYVPFEHGWVHADCAGETGVVA